MESCPRAPTFLMRKVRHFRTVARQAGRHPLHHHHHPGSVLKKGTSLKKLPWWKFQPAEYLTLISQSTLRYVTPNDYTPDMETMATKISHKVQEYRPPPPYLGIIPKKKQFYLLLPLFTLTSFIVCEAFVFIVLSAL